MASRDKRSPVKKRPPIRKFRFDNIDLSNKKFPPPNEFGISFQALSETEGSPDLSAPGIPENYRQILFALRNLSQDLSKACLLRKSDYSLAKLMNVKDEGEIVKNWNPLTILQAVVTQLNYVFVNFVGSSDYHINCYEEQMQKAEGECRNYIRGIEELKVYIEAIQSRYDEKLKEKDHTIYSLNKQLQSAVSEAEKARKDCEIMLRARQDEIYKEPESNRESSAKKTERQTSANRFLTTPNRLRAQNPLSVLFTPHRQQSSTSIEKSEAPIPHNGSAATINQETIPITRFAFPTEPNEGSGSKSHLTHRTLASKIQRIRHPNMSRQTSIHNDGKLSSTRDPSGSPSKKTDDRQKSMRSISQDLKNIYNPGFSLRKVSSRSGIQSKYLVSKLNIAESGSHRSANFFSGNEIN